MADLLDPTFSALIVLIGFAVLGGVAGALFGGSFGLVASGIALLLYGVVAGNVGAQHDREHVAFLVFSGVAAAVFITFLPITVVQGLAGFFIGYVIGLRLERR